MRFETSLRLEKDIHTQWPKSSRSTQAKAGAMGHSLLFIVGVATFVFLLFTRGTMFPPETYMVEDVDDGGSIFFLLFWPATAAYFGFLLLKDRRSLPTFPPILALLIGVLIFSLTQSVVLDIALRRLLGFITSLMAVYAIVAASPSPLALVKGVYYGSGLITVLSVISAIALPDLAIHHISPDLEGLWRGILSHKNHTAYAALLSLTTAVTLLRLKVLKGKVRLTARVVLLVSILLLYESSSEFLFVFGPPAALGVYLFGRIRRRSVFKITTAIVFLAIFSVAIWTTLDPKWPEYFGTTLNARTDIWSALVRGTESHEFLGRGYESIHRVGDQSVLWLYGYYRVRTLGHGHSGQLDTWASTGYVGLLVINLFLCQSLGKIYDARVWVPGPILSLSLFLLIVLIGRSFVESDFLTQGRGSWTIPLIFVLSLHPWSQVAKQASPPGKAEL